MTARVLVAMSLLAAVACRGTEPSLYVPAPDDRGPGPTTAELERQRTVVDRGHYPGGERLRTEREVLVLPDGTRLRHGHEASWFPDGQLEFERYFERGEPTGTWRTWYPDGTPRSETPTGAGADGRASWWHENGELSSRGPVEDGRKHGAWTHWHANGTRAAVGEYRRGRKQGPWTYWDEAGRVVAQGEYERGVRVGAWELRGEDGDLKRRGDDDTSSGIRAPLR